MSTASQVTVSACTSLATWEAQVCLGSAPAWVQSGLHGQRACLAWPQAAMWPPCVCRRNQSAAWVPLPPLCPPAMV
jgi:hypothetical protein